MKVLDIRFFDCDKGTAITYDVYGISCYDGSGGGGEGGVFYVCMWGGGHYADDGDQKRFQP